MKLIDKGRKIRDTYGIENQVKHFNSEVFELNEAIVKSNYQPIFSTREQWEHVAEEIADVQFMLNQIADYYYISDRYIEKIMEFKADRQLKRIEDEKTNN